MFKGWVEETLKEKGFISGARELEKSATKKPGWEWERENLI